VYKPILGWLVALNLLNLASSAIMAQEAPKASSESLPVTTEITDFRTKVALFRTEKPVETTCAIGAASGLATGSATYGTARLLKFRPKGLAGLATTAGLCVGTLAAIKFSGDNLAQLRSLQITELQALKTQAQTVSTGLSDLIHEHGLVRGVIAKVHSLAGQNHATVATELHKSKELADLISKTNSSVDQLGTDLTKRVLELEHTLDSHLEASHQKQISRATQELTSLKKLHEQNLRDKR